MSDLYDYMGWPLGGEFGRTVSKAADGPTKGLTMADLEEAVRLIDPDGTQLAATKLMAAVRGLSKQQIDNLTRLVGSEFFRVCLDEVYRGATIEGGQK